MKPRTAQNSIRLNPANDKAYITAGWVTLKGSVIRPHYTLKRNLMPVQPQN